MELDSKAILGRSIRALRESLGWSLERLAERSGISYQYLSAVETGKKNFSIAILDAIAVAMKSDLPTIIEQAYAPPQPIPVVSRANFIKGATLPPGLSASNLLDVLNETHKVVRLINAGLMRASGRSLSKYIQANNFSGIVSNILCDSFSRLSAYKHNHDQKYPDLICKKATPHVGLEVKSTIQVGKGGESHNGHSGWHVISCFQVLPECGDIQFVHVMFADLIGHKLANPDWKYLGSTVDSDTGSQRTETYNTTPAGTAKLRHGTVYLDPAIIKIARWRVDKSVAVPLYSPFRKLPSSK